MPIFILAIIAVMLSADAWWWWRADHLLRTLPGAKALRAFLAIFMIGCIAGLGVVIVSRFSWSVRDAMGAAGIAGLFIWHFLVLPVVAIPSVLLFLARKLARILNRPAADSTEFEVPRPPESAVLSRRQLLGATLASAPPLFTAIGTLRAMDQLDEFRIRKLTVPVASLPLDLDGMTIAHVSDVHVGNFTRGKTLDRIAAAANNLRADLVLQTGDLINHALADLPAGIEMTRKLEGRYGHYLCEGNHDLIESRAEFERRMTAAGLPLLINETAEVRVRGVPVQLMGLRWGWPATMMQRGDRRRSPDEAIAASMGSLIGQRDPDAFSILLAHHPHAFDIAARAGIPLTLAGHTHGGQLHLTEGIGFGPWMYRYWSGLYQQRESSLVVSNGVGNWFPLRINAPAEIIHITLRRA